MAVNQRGYPQVVAANSDPNVKVLTDCIESAGKWRIEPRGNGKWAVFVWDADSAIYGGPVGGDWEFIDVAADLFIALRLCGAVTRKGAR